MRTLLSGFVVFILTALVTYVVVERESHRAGLDQGMVKAQLEILQKVKAMLGDDLSAHEERELLFRVKNAAVVVVERNGVKTLRVE